ncbi:MAG TPA: glycosyl transferase family 2, partial [Anaerolineae bacterium]|nr:glycosyl transferase family 2 [Anaerolineae bacterium]
LVYIRFFTPLAIPGWATNVAIGLTVIMVQAVLFLALLSFFVLSYRSAKMFIPIVDYKDFVLDLEREIP